MSGAGVTRLAAGCEVTPVYALLVISGWHGATATKVIVFGETPARYRVRAITRTRLPGRGRFLEPVRTALVPRGALRFGQWSVACRGHNDTLAQDTGGAP